MMPPYRKKLIEVALPLEAINKESAREKSIRHGHPSTLHLWWARRPLAACRAVLFAQLVDDPSEYMPDEKSADEERQRLFKLIEELVKWENINNEELFDKARLEIAKSVARDLGVEVPVGKQAIREFLATKAPPVLDPFAGGGSIPLEAQRLGLRAYASDLNPVAVLINKAMIEIPPKFAGMPPVHPPENKEQQLSLMKKEWKGAEGLAEDVRYYGKWMRDEAFKRIGHLYPKYKITQELLDERPDLVAQGLKPGDELTVIAWLWTRTVKCPNPACGAMMPLIRSFWLSTKQGKETWVSPIYDRSSVPTIISYFVKMGKGSPIDGSVNRNGSHCIACGTPVPFEYVRLEGQAKRIGIQLWAIVAEGNHGRTYLPPICEHDKIAKRVIPSFVPETNLPKQALGFRVQLYGMIKHKDLFTNRQLVALSTFSNLISNLPSQLLNKDKKISIEYAKAISVYLSFVLDRMSQQSSTLSPWSSNPAHELVVNMFSRQTIQMVWDFGEINPFCKAASWSKCLDFVYKVLINTNPNTQAEVQVTQSDATSASSYTLAPYCLSTDPPYYDNIGYADLSDYFYVWLRQSLSSQFPDIFNTVLVPKTKELIASQFRFEGSREKAKKFFEEGLTKTFRLFKKAQHSGYPLSVFYAFKQSESEQNDIDGDLSNSNIASTGWETILEGLLNSGFSITGTWPIRTEKPGRMLSQNTNALASSVVLICRPYLFESAITTRRDFLSMLKQELPPALHQLQLGFIAPVDFAQAAIGPGMAIFSRYKQVLEADGSPMSVRTALGLINQALDEFLAEQEGEYDSDTRWALAWYEQYGFNEGPFGVAETLSKAKNTSVGGLEEAGILTARAGKVHLLSRKELKEIWNPAQDKRPTAWEAVQYLIKAMDAQGEQGAASLLSQLGSLGETARDLAYRLYTICERKGWAQDALGYNMLVVAWPRIKELARSKREVEQGRLL